MSRIIPFVCLLVLASNILTAQKKSELLSEISSLRHSLDSTRALVKTAQNNEKMSITRAQSFQEQVKELQSANATLLQNLNNFAQVSNTNSSNINRTLASLQDKERQLKSINEAIARFDSTAIVVLTNTKQTLGENARISVVEGAVNVMADLTLLFGSSDQSELSPEGVTWLEKVALVLKTNPDLALTIEGLSMTGEIDLATTQAAAAGRALQNFGIDPDRIRLTGKDGNFKEGILLKMHPKFQQFYLMVRENMKNAKNQ